MRRHIPNMLTVLRLILAAVFFAALSMARYGWTVKDAAQTWLLIGIVLFVAAAVTDALDGYLARRWKVESKFGRIMDPVCDKILILGALVFLAGPRFAVTAGPGGSVQVSGVYPWMVVVILLRELLVTGIRAEMESGGIRFGANVWGKLKMILQSVVVPVVLLLILFLEPDGERNWAAWLRDGLVYATVIVTVISGIPYITRARGALREAGNSSGTPQ